MGVEQNKSKNINYIYLYFRHNLWTLLGLMITLKVF